MKPFVKSIVLLAVSFASMSIGCASEATDSEVTAESSDESALRATDASAIVPSDVSVLFAAPTETSLGYLTASSQGRGGPLLPASVMDVLPKRLDFSSTGPASGRTYFQGARLVGIRLDPCAGELGTQLSPSCKAQVRLVFQAPNSGGTMDDGAVHAFYSLSRPEVLSLLDTIVVARRASGASVTGPLGVHPAVVRQGMQGNFARKVMAKVIALAGTTNLTRVTFFSREVGRPKQWTFGQFSVSTGTPSRLTIQTVGATTQVLKGTEVTPPSTHADNFLKFPDFDGRRVDAALRVENPKVHTPDTIGCVECHQTHPELVLKPLGKRFEFTSVVSTAVVGNGGDQENLHFFSFMGVVPSVSQRTGNESAAVVERFRAVLRSR